MNQYETLFSLSAKRCPKITIKVLETISKRSSRNRRIWKNTMHLRNCPRLFKLSQQTARA